MKYKDDIKTQRRFWTKVQQSKQEYNGSKCLNWAAGHSKEGYGLFKIKGNKSMVLAHRYSYSLFFGNVPENICVLHHCDNPKCVNPNHLFLGTRQDNNQDKANKNRSPYGENNYWSKLTMEEVDEIRRIYKPRDKNTSGRALAKRFGVGKTTIMNIIHRVRWNKKNQRSN